MGCGGDLSNFLGIQMRKQRLEGQQCSSASIHTTPTQAKRQRVGGGGQWGASILTDMVAAPDGSSWWLPEIWAQGLSSQPSLYPRILHINSSKPINEDFGPFCQGVSPSAFPGTQNKQAEGSSPRPSPLSPQHPPGLPPAQLPSLLPDLEGM